MCQFFNVFQLQSEKDGKSSTPDECDPAMHRRFLGDQAWLQRRQWLPELPQSLRERSWSISKRLSRISTRDRALTAEKSLPKDILMNFCPCSRVGFKHLMQNNADTFTLH